MTLRGCVIGNSHLSAVRFAAADPASIPTGVVLDFVGSAQSGLADVALDGQRLIATSAATQKDFQRFGAVEAIDLTRYDFFVLVGLNLSVYGLEAFYRNYRCIGLRDWQSLSDARELISRAVAQMIIGNRLQTSLAARLARIIGSAVDVPIFLQAQPRPGKAMLGPNGKYPTFRKMLRRKETASLSALFESAAAQLTPYYLPQPSGSIEDDLFTAAAYCEGSVRLTPDVGKPLLHPPDDYMHANSAYGMLVLQQLGQALMAKGITSANKVTS
jgi:hypothetical protein